MRVEFHVPPHPSTLEAALEGLVATNAVLLRAGAYPRLLGGAGVRYQREPKGRERWQTVPEVLRSGRGDCEDLAAWLAAECRVRGVPARVRVVRTGRGRYHAVVQLPDGRVYDPSRALGMGRRR